MSDKAPGKRQVVVLRAGPPKRRGIIVDAVFGILGVALLILAVVLGQTLPEEEVLPEQFLPEMDQLTTKDPVVMVDRDHPQGDTDLGATVRYTQAMPEGDVRTIELPIERDNVYQIQVDLTFPGDDIPSSLPDRLDMELEAPNGTIYEGVDAFIVTAPPEREPANQTSEAIYTSPSVTKTMTFRLPAVPTPDFITSNATGFDATDALRIANELYTHQTAGTWIIRVTMSEAGDCPDGMSPEQLQRALVCSRDTDGSNEDPGNPYSVSNVRYSYYNIRVPDPDETGDGTLQTGGVPPP